MFKKLSDKICKQTYNTESKIKVKNCGVGLDMIWKI